jgi:hypothetical protein
MTARHAADEPELVPPAELLRLRAELRRGPSASTRAKHLAAAVEVSRQHAGGAAGRFASRGVRAAVAVVASLVITSGLAAAQVLPPPAQRFLSSVSDRFSPPTTARPARAGDAGRGSATTLDGAEGSTGDSGTSGDGVVTTPTSEGASTTRPGATATTQPRTDDTTLPTVTVPGPLGPGSPDDPTDPGTDGGPTDPGTDSTDGPTDPGTTTTTTTVGGTDGGTDGAGTADVTTTTAPASGGSD